MSDPDGFILAIDIGGTKLAAARVDPDGQVLSRQQVPTLPTGTGDGDALWSTLLGLIDEVCAGGRPVAVGVGCGGPLRAAEGLVSPLNIPAWRDYPLRERLRERFPTVDIRLANDAIAMAVGEHWRGAGRDTASFLGIVVSTGVGGGLVLDGRVVEGRSGQRRAHRPRRRRAGRSTLRLRRPRLPRSDRPRSGGDSMGAGARLAASRGRPGDRPDVAGRRT